MRRRRSCAEPRSASWQLHHVNAVDSVADIGQHEVSAAVGSELLGSCCLDQHGQSADGEEDGRNRSCENCHACHAEDATEDRALRRVGSDTQFADRPHG